MRWRGRGREVPTDSSGEHTETRATQRTTRPTRLIWSCLGQRLVPQMPMAQRTKRKMLAIRCVAGDRSLDNAGGFSDLFAAIRTSITRRIPPVNPTSNAALPVLVVYKPGVFRHQSRMRNPLPQTTVQSRFYAFCDLIRFTI